jgi:hypothetical protein
LGAYALALGEERQNTRPAPILRAVPAYRASSYISPSCRTQADFVSNACRAALDSTDAMTLDQIEEWIANHIRPQ